MSHYFLDTQNKVNMVNKNFNTLDYAHLFVENPVDLEPGRTDTVSVVCLVQLAGIVRFLNIYVIKSYLWYQNESDASGSCTQLKVKSSNHYTDFHCKKSVTVKIKMQNRIYYIFLGVYIMQNTMVEGRGSMAAGETIKN